MRFSFVIPAHNAARFLPISMGSILDQQTHHDIELIIVNDCSSDATQTLLQPYKNITVIHNDIQQGPGISRNIGAAAAKGNVLVFLDADCALVGTNWVEIAAALIASTTALSLRGKTIRCDQQETVAQFRFHELLELQPTEPTYLDAVSTDCFIIDAALFARSGGFPALRYQEDMCFGQKLRELGVRTRFSPELGIVQHFRTKIWHLLQQQHSWAYHGARLRLSSPNIRSMRHAYSAWVAPVHLVGISVFYSCILMTDNTWCTITAFALPYLGILGYPRCVLFLMHQRRYPSAFLWLPLVVVVRNTAWLAGVLRAVTTTGLRRLCRRQPVASEWIAP